MDSVLTMTSGGMLVWSPDRSLRHWMMAPLWVRCPACQQMSASKDISRSRAVEDVYECDDCGHVWHVSRELPPRSSKPSRRVLKVTSKGSRR